MEGGVGLWAKVEPLADMGALIEITFDIFNYYCSLRRRLMVILLLGFMVWLDLVLNIPLT